MIRFLNFVAIGALIGTAVWVYSIKYETIFYAEQVKKLEHRLDKERDAIVVLQAEWQFLNQPGRLQALSDRFLQAKPLEPRQIIRPSELPDKPPPAESLAQRLDALITGSTTPAGKTTGARTPGSL